MAEYIDREALIHDIGESVIFTVKSGQPSAEIRGANKIIDRIYSAPTADFAEVRHGEWGHRKTLQKIVCSKCGSPRPFQKTKRGYHVVWESNYCPNCGAKMDLKGE